MAPRFRRSTTSKTATRTLSHFISSMDSTAGPTATAWLSVTSDIRPTQLAVPSSTTITRRIYPTTNSQSPGMFVATPSEGMATTTVLIICLCVACSIGFLLGAIIARVLARAPGRASVGPDRRSPTVEGELNETSGPGKLCGSQPTIKLGSALDVV